MHKVVTAITLVLLFKKAVNHHALHLFQICDGGLLGKFCCKSARKLAEKVHIAICHDICNASGTSFYDRQTFLPKNPKKRSMGGDALNA